MEELKEGRKGGKGRKRRSKRCTESGGTRGIIRPSVPQAHPSPPLFSYLPHTLPCTTPLDYSRHSSHPLPLHLSRSFDLVSRTPSLSTSRRVSTSCVPPNGVTLLLCVISVRVTAKLLLTFRPN